METLQVSSAASFRAFSCRADGHHKAQCGRVKLSLGSACSPWQSTSLLKASFKADYPMHVRLSVKRANGVLATVAAEDEVDDVSPSKPESNDEVKRSVLVLKTAAKTRKGSVSEICAAFRTLEKQKLDPSDFPEIIGGTKSPGRTWMLVFTADKQNTGGRYFPITAVQKFDAEASRLENGVFLGPLGSFTLSGGYVWDKRKQSFFFHTISLKIGSLGPFDFNIGSKEKEIGKDDAFFIWYYADEEIVVAKGRAGGIAYWVRCVNVQKSLS